VTRVVLVPTYDEAATIAVLLERLLALPEELHVLVIDDRSPDGTGEIVARIAAEEARVGLLVPDQRGGLGAAYRAGYAHRWSRGATVVCQMDADLSHTPEQLSRLLAAIDAGADVAIGSRYVPGGDVRGWSRRRLVLSRAANRYVRAFTGCPVRDATSGFRAYRAATLAAIGVERTTSDGYAFQIEMTLRALEVGGVVTEVPITFVERVHGHSKLAGSVAREAAVKVARWGWEQRGLGRASTRRDAAVTRDAGAGPR
jgi:dolichol-phosphate mannosyltransferase